MKARFHFYSSFFKGGLRGIMTIAFLLSPLSAARLSYQGVLTSGDGVPVEAEGTSALQMTFELCADSPCSSVPWSDTIPVEVSGGIFAVELGREGNEIEASDISGGDLYLRVSIGEDNVFTDPQTHAYQHLTSVPYAMGSQGDFVVNGKLGIGTGDPQQPLHILQPAGSNADLALTSGEDRNTAIIGVVGRADGMQYGTSPGDLVIRNDNGDIIFSEHGDDERMRIERGTGNVGIGTARPSKKLEVYGTGDEAQIAISYPTGGYGQFSFIEGTTPRAYIHFNDASDNLYFSGSGAEQNDMTISSSGNVGIGTVNPEYDLDVKGDIRASGAIRADQDLEVNEDVHVGGVIYGDSSNEGYYLDPDGESRVLRMVVSEGMSAPGLSVSGDGSFGGSVGVGTSLLDPDYRLTVEGGIYVSEDIQLERNLYLVGGKIYEGSNSGSQYYLNMDGESQVFRLNVTDALNAPSIRAVTSLMVDGNVGIGTASNSQYKLDVNGAIRAANLEVGPIRNSTGNIYLDGNVGIGVEAPQAPLHVAGDARFDGDIQFGGKLLSDCYSRFSENNHCYTWFNSLLTFYEALKACERLGGYLATLTSADEDDYVWRNVGHSSAWIGFVKLGSWGWVTGESTVYDNDGSVLGYGYTHWALGQPDGYGGCAQYNAGGSWDDDSCKEAKSYICERDF